ncbi:MAG: phage polymerase-related protein, partial [Ilumatobacteraceae bacterium]|nr:phage polymerase-related protein [Ilumatobacteraceae bacterium]
MNRRTRARADDGRTDVAALAAAARAAAECTACPLWEHATQVVFGLGGVDAKLMLIGEQPGDREDVAGEPFVGPAGGVLWRCLASAGIDRADVYVTNAVKHFKHEVRGKRRIHQKPNVAEITACHPWLDRELAAVDAAAVVVLLGATAVRSVLGRDVPIGSGRGAVHTFEDPHGTQRRAVITYHPSAVLRADER